MKKENKIILPKDLSYGKVIYLMTGEELVPGTGIFLSDCTPLFVKTAGEPVENPGSFIADCAVGEFNGDRQPFGFDNLNHHKPKKEKIGEIFLNEEDALENWKNMMNAAERKVSSMIEPVRNLNKVVQEKTSIAPLPTFKSNNIDISLDKEQKGKDDKKSFSTSASFNVEVKGDEE